MTPPHRTRPRFRPSVALPFAVVLLALLLPHLPGLPAAHGAGGAPVAAADGSTVATDPDRVGRAALEVARGLASGAAGTGPVSTEVRDALGYTPGHELGLPSDPDGDCSTPVPLPARFEAACRVHDLGYDLLRIAHHDGDAIPPGLRSDLDALLLTQWHRACDGDSVCALTADVAGGAVRLNTLRQRHGAPVEESWPW